MVSTSTEIIGIMSDVGVASKKLKPSNDVGEKWTRLVKQRGTSCKTRGSLLLLGLHSRALSGHFLLAPVVTILPNSIEVLCCIILSTNKQVTPLHLYKLFLRNIVHGLNILRRHFFHLEFTSF